MAFSLIATVSALKPSRFSETLKVSDEDLEQLAQNATRAMYINFGIEHDQSLQRIFGRINKIMVAAVIEALLGLGYIQRND